MKEIFGIAQKYQNNALASRVAVIFQTVKKEQ